MLRSVLLGLAILGLAAACARAQGHLQSPEERAPGAKQAREEDALKQAAVTLQEGLDRLDAVALGRMLADDAEFRTRLGQLRTHLLALEDTGGTPVVVGRRLRIEVTRYTGSLRVSGWVDAREHWFWRDRRFDDKDAQLAIDYRKVVDDLWNDVVRDVQKLPRVVDLGVLALGVFAERRELIAARYQQRVEAEFRSFLGTARLVPGPDQGQVELPDRLLAPGVHAIRLEVTPVGADRNGRWSLRGQVLSVPAAGAAERIKEFDLDSDRFPNHALGSPLPPLSAFVRVRDR